MNNYCRHCGSKMIEGNNVCPNCETEVVFERINVEERQKEINEYKIKEKNFFLIIIGMFVIAKVFSRFDKLEIFCPLIYLADFITLVYANITLKNSKLLQTTFNIVICAAALFIIGMILLLLSCTGALNRGC